MKYKNPIISGFNPDPSICRVGEDYYVVTSTFEYFPGIPIYHSKNLVNWELQGYCLDDDKKLVLNNCTASAGLYAPTIRYHQGTFFVTCTNVSDRGNFIIYTDNMEKGWSDPVWVNQGGIDPSLFFDEDGKVYVTTSYCAEDMGVEIWISEVNPFTGEMLTESKLLSKGCGGKNPEAPHIYKIRGKYYLMLAEGGTEYSHMETIQRADNIYGPYEQCPHNPIVTHMDQVKINIHCVGHGDLVEDQNGNWWMVCLGIRTCSNYYLNSLLHNLGRETFLAPVLWDEAGWPIVGNAGNISEIMEGPLPSEEVHEVMNDFFDDFSEEEFSLEYNYIRNPFRENYIRDTASKQLILKGNDVTLNDTDSPVWIGVRQKAFDTLAIAEVSISGEREGMRAGLTAYYNEAYHYEVYLTRTGDTYRVCLAKHVHDIFVVSSSVEIPSGENIWLRISTNRDYYEFSYSLNGLDYSKLGTGVTAGLCTEGTMTMTFTGTYLAMFAEKGNGYFKNLKITEY